MFDRVVEVLKAGTGEAGFTQRDVSLAIAVLYFHMINADGVVTREETEKFRSMLVQQFAWSSEELDDIIASAAREDVAAPGLFSFAAILNQQLAESERELMVKRLDDLARSDGDFHPLESDLLEHVRKLLHVS